MIDDRQRQLRIGMLIATHVLVGSATIIVNVSVQNQFWPFLVELGFAGFFAGEVLLLGMWAGLGGSPWWTRLCGLMFGIAWLCIIALASENFRQLQELPEMALLLTVSTFGVAGSLILCRRLFGSIERCVQWPSPIHTEDLQFKLKSLLSFTALICTLLAAGATIRRWGGDGLGIVILALVFALNAVLTAWLLAWGGLGSHNWFRIPITLSGVALVGLLPPYYLGGPPWRFATWVAMSVVTAIWTLVSLFVVRSCGYRLVRHRDPTPSNELLPQSVLK